MKRIIQIIFRRLFIKSTLSLALIFGMISAEAADIGADVSVGVGYSDNITRTELDPVDDVIGILGLRFDLDQSTARIDANIRSNAYFLTYDKGTFDDEVIAAVAASVEISLIEERLNWYFGDYFGQQQIDVFQPVRPDNREDVNYFTTGPNIRLPLGVRTAFGADLRYTNVEYEFRTDDNVRGSARVWLGRDISEARTLSINAFAESVEFDDPQFTQDFDRFEGFLRWDGGAGRNATGLAPAVGRNVFGIDVGYTELEVDLETASGYLVRADWTRTMTARSTLVMRAGSRYSDQGDIFGDYQNVARGIGDTEDIDGDGRPFRNNFFDISYNTQRRLTWVSLQLGWSQEDYELGFDRDRDIFWGRLVLERDFSDKTFVYLNSRFDVRDYKYDPPRKDDDLSIEISFGYRLGRRVTVALQYRYFQRNSTAAAADFKEHRGFLTFTYTPAWGEMRRR